MIYFSIGLSSRYMYIDKIIQKSKLDNILYFNEDNFNDFFNECYNNSLFSIPSLLILKNSNKIKGIEKIILKLIDKEINDKTIIIEYESEKEPKDFMKSLSNKKNFEMYSCFDIKENRKLFLKYIEKRLNCNKIDAEKLLNITDTNYHFLKNEIDKIECFLDGNQFDFENNKELISKNTNFFIFNIIDEILSKKMIEFPIKDDMAVFSSLVKDLEILYKLKISNIRSSNYSSFKNILSETYLFNEYSPYYVFNKQKFLDNFSLDDINKLMTLAFKIEYDIKNGIIPLKEGVEIFIMQVIK